MLADPGAKDEIKLKAAQELSENFEVCGLLCSALSEIHPGSVFSLE